MFRPRNTVQLLAASVPAYAIGRKVPILWNARIHEYDYRKNARIERPMLVTEKVALCALSCLTIIYLPFWVYKDASKLEIMARGLSLEEYGYDNRSMVFFDYMFV